MQLKASFAVSYLICLFGLSTVAFAQVATENSLKLASESLDKFSLKVLSETSSIAGDSANIALGSYTIWSILGIINEGARNRTEEQLTNTLGIQKETFRYAYQQLNKKLTQSAPGVDLTLSNAIFVPNADDIALQADFDYQIRHNYKVYADKYDKNSKSLDKLNQYISMVTKNKIRSFFNMDDLTRGDVLLVSTFFFKGTWMRPFNRSRTTKVPFYNERSEEIAKVDMMFQAGPFPYTIVNSISSVAVEIPYGIGDRMSMIVLLPRKGTPLNKVLKELANIGFNDVFDALAKAEAYYLDEDVQIYIPKFKISSDFTLNLVMHQLGIKDLFNQQDADLTGMFNHYLYVSKLIQKAEIEVDEEGTEAAATASASFINKSPPPAFKADRPFAYFIVDKPTRSIVFSGKLAKPN